MKKKMCIFIAAAMVSVFSTAVYADEISEVKNKVYYIIDSNADQYGGYYQKDNEIHIVPYRYAKKAYMPNKEIKEISEENNIEIIYDKDVRYSFADLKDGYKKLIEKWSELGLKEISTDTKSNSIILLSDNWSEEKKRLAKKYSGIENIVFKSSNETETENSGKTNVGKHTVESENPYSAMTAVAWALRMWF